MATVVCFHAHPDDEVLVTGGTIAMLAAEGHRVVIVVACDGVMFGPDAEAPAAGGGRSRLDELRASAAILGAARVEHLGYADSGHGPVLYPDPPGRVRFARADPEEAAQRLAGLLRQEQASLLISYDEHGGYGHRDHVRVHQVGALAAFLAGTPRLAEATVPREPFTWLTTIVQATRLITRFDAPDIRSVGTPHRKITHRLNVGRFAASKRAALAAHASQAWPASSGRSARLFWLLARLPVPVFALLLGREWFTETGAGADDGPPLRPGRKKNRLL